MRIAGLPRAGAGIVADSDPAYEQRECEAKAGALIAAVLMLPAFGALAQEGGAAAPAAGTAGGVTEGEKTVEVSPGSKADPKNNWLKLCDPLDDGKKVCVMRQVVMSSGGQFLGSFLLRDDPGQESRLLAVAAVPLGVLLPFGLTWQIDGGKPIRVPFRNGKRSTHDVRWVRSAKANRLTVVRPEKSRSGEPSASPLTVVPERQLALTKAPTPSRNPTTPSNARWMPTTPSSCAAMPAMRWPR